MSGLIVSGYPGVGKSYISNIETGYVDLKSTLIKENSGVRPMDWRRIYCNLAVSLADQGYDVCVSTHKEVLKELSNTNLYGDLDVVVVFPVLELREEWLSKLAHRLADEPTPENWYAYINAETNYIHDVKNLTMSNFPTIQITSLDYDLKEMLDTYKTHLSNSVES